MPMMVVNAATLIATIDSILKLTIAIASTVVALIGMMFVLDGSLLNSSCNEEIVLHL